MCYYIHWYCLLCKRPHNGPSDLAECKKGSWDWAHHDTNRCYKQNLIANLFHESCYLRAGGTRQRYNAVAEQLRLEVNEWLHSDDNSIPVKKEHGVFRRFENFGGPECYFPSGTVVAPDDYEVLVTRHARLTGQDPRAALGRLRDWHSM
jgi:hypothetical protein